MQALMAHQIQDLQRQWHNTLDQLKQAAPVAVPAPMQPMPSLAPPGPAFFMQPHQGFGNHPYPPISWPSSMAMNPMCQPPPPHQPLAMPVGQGGGRY
jgi:hypothetical protein